MRRVRGTKGLVFDGISEITSLVERTALRVAEKTTDYVSIAPPLAPAAQVVRSTHGAIFSTACASVRTISRGVEVAVDVGIDLAERTTDAEQERSSHQQGTMPWALDQIEGAVNGVLGDYLTRRANPLALEMTLRHDGIARSPEQLVTLLEQPTATLCIFVHGLACTEWCWNMQSDSYGEDAGYTYASQLARDLDITSVFVRYNTGRAIKENGHALANLIEELAAAYPEPLDRIVLIGHSMGGLVSRVAAADAHQRELAWASSLEHIICLGSPHHGAPLERAARNLAVAFDFADVAATRVLGEVLGVRSAGILDLGDGVSIEVPGVRLSVVASTAARDPEKLGSAFVGDLLVPTSSASGEKLEVDDVALFGGINHVQLTNHAEIYPTLRQWLER